MRYLIGLGNYAMGDDGIGLRIVEHIADHRLDTDFEVVEAGNDGMLVLTYFSEETERLVIVDAVKFGGRPGEFTVFSPDEVETRKVTGGISTHEGDILKLIALARQLDQPVPPTRIVAIEPAAMVPDTGLSPALVGRLAEYVDVAVNEARGVGPGA
jgi:hydrogenase maturation protease